MDTSKKIMYDISSPNKKKKQSKSGTKEENGMNIEENVPKVKEKRVECLKWAIQPTLLEHFSQLTLLNGAFTSANEPLSAYFETYPLFKQQIDHKLSGYKHQDVKKNIYDKSKFINFTQAIELLHLCNMTCAYCNENVVVLYENVREPYQWSLDRIDNYLGHNHDNLMVACLKCNLKRRRTNMDAFMFTKQMKLIKTDDSYSL